MMRIPTEAGHPWRCFVGSAWMIDWVLWSGQAAGLTCSGGLSLEQLQADCAAGGLGELGVAQPVSRHDRDKSSPDQQHARSFTWFVLASTRLCQQAILSNNALTGLFFAEAAPVD
jgi:hypothetical protein